MKDILRILRNKNIQKAKKILNLINSGFKIMKLFMVWE